MNSKNKNTSAADITPENLAAAIEKCRREEVMRMLKGGVLTGLDDEKREDIYRRLAGLRSMEIMEVLSKQKEPFTADMLNLDFDISQNRNFVREVLEKYSKKFDYSNETECNKLFALACTADEEKMVKALIRHGEAMDSYAMIGSASLPVFGQITLLQSGLVSDDVLVQIYLNAFLSDDAEKKMIYMDEKGIDFFIKNADGKSAADLLEERIMTRKYPNNKKGTMQKRQEEQTLKLVKKIRSDHENSTGKKSFAKKTIIIVAACVVVLAVAGILIGRAYVSSSSSEEETTEETSTDDTDSEDETSTDDADSEDTDPDDETTSDDTDSEEETSAEDSDTEEETTADDSNSDDETTAEDSDSEEETTEG